MKIEKAQELSLRIKDNNNQLIGSGVLFTPNGAKAYILTAAHVIKGTESETLFVEFFHCADEKDFLYRLELKQQDFVCDLL